jgi:acetoin utilization deacetylase AcuC-like enzyme
LVGTEEGFKEDPDFFYGSTHQKHCYPGTGPDPSPFIADKAKKEEFRRIVDRYLNAGPSSRKEFHVKWIQVLQEMERFKPELILISAGFDAHDDDPLADCELADEDYDWATAEVLKSGLRINPQNPPPIISALEGGYDLDAISRSSLLHVKRLYAGYNSVREEVEKEGKVEDWNGNEVEALKNALKDMGIDK